MDACPEGGCLLLRPGTYTLKEPSDHSQYGGPSVRYGLSISRSLHIFGRGLATLLSPGPSSTGIRYHATVSIKGGSSSLRATLDGLTVVTVHGPGAFSSTCHTDGVVMDYGASRLQSCAITGLSRYGLRFGSTERRQLSGGSRSSSLAFRNLPPPVAINCRCGRGSVRFRSIPLVLLSWDIIITPAALRQSRTVYFGFLTRQPCPHLLNTAGSTAVATRGCSLARGRGRA